MPRILRTNAATEDLVEIFTQAAGSPPLLARRRAAFDRTLTLLAENPALGSRRLPNHPEVRVFPCDRYLIFYRPLAAGDGIAPVAWRRPDRPLPGKSPVDGVEHPAIHHMLDVAAVAEVLALPPARRDLVVLMAALHDLGKIGQAFPSTSSGAPLRSWRRPGRSAPPTIPTPRLPGCAPPAHSTRTVTTAPASAWRSPRRRRRRGWRGRGSGRGSRPTG